MQSDAVRHQVSPTRAFSSVAVPPDPVSQPFFASTPSAQLSEHRAFVDPATRAATADPAGIQLGQPHPVEIWQESAWKRRGRRGATNYVTGSSPTFPGCVKAEFEESTQSTRVLMNLPDHSGPPLSGWADNPRLCSILQLHSPSCARIFNLAGLFKEQGLVIFKQSSRHSNPRNTWY